MFASLCLCVLVGYNIFNEHHKHTQVTVKYKWHTEGNETSVHKEEGVKVNQTEREAFTKFLPRWTNSLTDHNQNMTLPPEKYVQYVMGQHNQHTQSLTEEVMKCKTGKTIGLNDITNDLLRETIIHFKKYCKYGHPCNMLGT